MAVPYPIINNVFPLTQSIAGLNQFIYSTNWTAAQSSDVIVWSRAPNVPANDITQLVNPSTYTVQFIGSDNLVQVTFNAGQNPPQYNIVTIFRETVPQWLNNYTNTNFLPSMLNSDFDNLTFVDQQLETLVRNVIPGYNISETLNIPIDTVLPILGANQLWVKNSTNTAFIAVDISDLPNPYAPDDSPFVTYAPSSELTDAFNLGSLGNGILAQNTSSSISTPYILSLPLTVPYGGTGDTTFTAYSVLCAGTTATGALQNVSGLGTSGQVLTSNGIGALPTWQSVVDITPAALTEINDTNVTLTLGGTPATSLLQAVSLTLGWTGQLSLLRGGSNANLTASNGGIVYSTASAMAILSGTATANQVLLSGSSASPSWSTATYPASTTINQLLYSSSNNVIAGISVGANGVLISSNSNVPSWLANGTAGYVLTANSGGPPSWQAPVVTSAITTINGDAGSVTGSTVTITGGTTGLTYSGSGTTLTLGGTLAIANGGTNKTSVTTTPAATAWAGWDTNKNLSANNMISELTSTVSSGSTIVLTVASTQIQNVTGTTPQTIQMPVASTLPSTGTSYILLNNTTATMTVVSSGSNTIGSIAAGNSATVTNILASGTTAASWFMYVPGFTPSTFTAANDTNVTATLTGFPTVALLQPMTFTLGWTGQLSLIRGGTNSSLTASNGGIVYSTASALAILSGTSTAQQLLVSGASAAPQWTTTTYPLTNAINTLLYASSANVISALATANSGVLVTSSGGVPSISTTLPSGLSATNMTLTTPAIGTPTSGVATNLTATGGVRSFQVFTSGTAATYTKPANVTSILVEVLGGGGAGGGAAGSTGTASGGGGGGGGYARLYIASPSSTYTYTVGAGGTAGTAGNNPGNSGGTTTFSASSLQATGGAGGNGSANSATVTGANQGVGGIGSNGNINSAGGCGSPGIVLLGSTGAALIGSGGPSIYGGGGAPTGSNTTGAAGIGYGGGGNGAMASSINQQGGAGSAGLIIVWEFS